MFILCNVAANKVTSKTVVGGHTSEKDYDIIVDNIYEYIQTVLDRNTQISNHTY